MKIPRSFLPHLPFIGFLILVAGAVYLKTLSPSILYIDAGTMVAAASSLGIANPPGFPAYILIGHLFTLLPIGTVLFRMQLLSIVSSLGILVLVYFVLNRLINTDFWFVRHGKEDKEALLGIDYLKGIKPLSVKTVRFISLASVLILAFSYQFWSQTLNSEAYMLTNFFMACLLIIILTVPINSMISTRRLVLGAVLLGVSTGTNPTIVQALPALLIGAGFFWKKIGIKRVFMVILIVAAITALVYSYLPLRAAQYPFLNWGNPQTPQLFFGHLRGEGLDINDPRTNSINGFTGSPKIFAQSIGRYIFLLCLQFTPLLLPLIGLGIFYCFKKNKRLLLVLISIPVINLIFGGLYLSGNQESWFIASYIIFAIFIGIGLSILVKFLGTLSFVRRTPKMIFVLLAAVALLPFLWWVLKLDRSGDIVSNEYADNLYSNLPKGTVLIGSGDFFNSLSLYEHEVLKRREDVFPVVANMWYILPWYRDNLRHQNPDLMPQELEGMIKKDRLEEYNEVMNWYINWLIDKGHPVYVTPMVFSETVLAGTNAGRYNPDFKKLKVVPSGLAYRILKAEDLLQPSEKSFDYKFKDPKFFNKPPFYLERNYNAAYHLLLQQYGVSYLSMVDYFYAASGEKSLSIDEKDLMVKKSAEYMAKAYEIAPFSADIVNRKAIFAANQGDLKQAIKYFKETINLVPNSFEAHLNLAKAFNNNNQPEEAKKELQYIINNDSDKAIKADAESELIKITGKQMASNIPEDWQKYESKQQGFSFRYPKDWKLDNANGIATVSSGSFYISFYAGSLAGGESAESWLAKSPIKFSGTLDKKGLAQIPGFDAQAAFWADNSGKQALEFVLALKSRIFHLKVYPVGDKAMENLDLILSSIKF